MPKGEVPSRSEQEADECLHCAIMDMVDERIAADVWCPRAAAAMMVSGSAFHRKGLGSALCSAR